MAGRRGPVAITAAVFAVGMAALAVPPAAASPHSPAKPRVTASPHTSASPHSTVSPPAGPQDATQGGAQLASTGIVVNPLSHSTPRLPRLKVDAFVVANAGTGQVLAARDAHGWFRPASTLKVLTALALIPVLNPNASTVASRQAADTEPNDAGLVAGRSYQISSLFQALLTISANDAAVALTQATGSFSKGMALINAEAHELQADDTVAVQPNGLDAAGQHESAYDEALIARQALASPTFLGYDRTLSARFEVKPKHWETLINQDQLLTDYPGDIGGKLGWTTAASGTFMAMARRNGVTLIVTILHCPPGEQFAYATKLLSWGFAASAKVRPVGTLVSPLPPAPPPAPKKRAAHTVKHVTTRPVADSASSAATPVAVGVGFLVLASLIVAAFVARHRRALAPAAKSRKLLSR
ncbi:MAG: D-alanyl-D-alanine carboxypeptidase family protein [Streptosporangiaceae bacterium]